MNVVGTGRASKFMNLWGRKGEEDDISEVDSGWVRLREVRGERRERSQTYRI